MSLRTALFEGLIRFSTTKTKRKLLVIESDDWGSRRTDSVEVRDLLNKISPTIEGDPFSQLDNLASEHDMELLFDVLNSVRDNYDNPACLTMNVTTANPDFAKIKESNFETFYYEPFYKTITDRSTRGEVLSMWREGMQQGFLFPQLHGREHVHALAWLSELRLGNPALRRAFDLSSYGIPYVASFRQRRKNLQAALDSYGIDGEREFQERWIVDSVRLFEGFFGFAPKTFISPAYVWTPLAEKTLAMSGLAGIQGIRFQFVPDRKATFYRKRLRFTGRQTNGLTSLVRNAFFEPFSDRNKDWVDSCLAQVKKAFDAGHPAIIGSHRVNYIGSLSQKNRDQTLVHLSKMLRTIRSKWQDVEFISSNSLINLI